MLDSFVRCRPEDGTNGFFVACFVRKLDKAANPLKRKAEEEPDGVIDASDEREGTEEYGEWYGISGGDPGLATQSGTQARRKKRKQGRTRSSINLV